MSFKWIAAGTAYDGFGGFCIYVKIKNRKGDYEERHVPNGIHVKLKDRELFLTKPGVRDYNLYTPICGFDYCVDCDVILKNSAVKHSGIMLAYEDSPNRRAIKYDKSKLTQMYIGDSGGFQILSGVRNFVDPIDLAKFYNQYVTHGMILDIPVRLLSDVKIIKKTALMQRKNTEVILKHLKKDVQLYNVSHGTRVDIRRKFIDTVHHDKINNWAIGGSSVGNIFDMIYQIFSVTTYVKADKYHILGVANTLAIIILAWIGKYINLTSDSSSHLQSGLCNVIFTITEHKFKKLAVGGQIGRQLQSPNISALLPSSDPILGSVDTTEIFNHATASKVCYYLAILHNITSLAQYAQIWNDLAQTLSVKDYKKLMKKTVPERLYHHYSSAIDFIESIIHDGFDKAAKRFKTYISLLSIKEEDFGIKLFSKNENCSTVNPMAERITEILKNFKRYHAGEKIDAKKGRRTLDLMGNKMKSTG